jgi:AraC-like DNA-binding protein
LKFSNIATIAGIALCLLSSIILFIYNKRKISASNFLAAYFLTIAYGLFIILTISTKYIEVWPHTFRTGLLAYYLVSPFAYLYIKKIVEPSRSNWRDLLCFLPALFFLIDYTPFFLLPSEAKLTILKDQLKNLNMLLSFNEGWITPRWFHQIFRHLTALFFWILSVRLIIRIYKVKQPEFYLRNRNTLRWLILFVVAQFFIFAPYLIIGLLKQMNLIWAASIFPGVLISCITSALLFFEPSIIYGFEGIILPPNNSLPLDPGSNLSIPGELNPSVSMDAEINLQGNNEQYMDLEKITELETTLSRFFLNKKPFLVPGYTINDLAKDCRIPSRRLSAYLNQVMSLNFTEFLNKHRIEYCLMNLKAGAWKNLTLEAIARESGFNNRNSYTRSFKKNTGINPSVFILRLKNNSQ